MKVWTLSRCYDYEGSEIEGVFRTKRQAEKYRDESRYTPDEWLIESWRLSRAKRRRRPVTECGSERG